MLAFILFGVPERKDAEGSEAWNPDGIVQLALRDLRDEVGDDLVVIADLCLDEYTDHGHCGVLDDDGDVDNDATLERYRRIAIAQAEAGAADRRAQRDDGRPGRRDPRRARRGWVRTRGDPRLRGEVRLRALRPVPRRGRVRAAVRRPQGLPDGPAERREALREIEADIDQGADMVMVKPALAYLDVIRRAKDRTRFPIAAYHVTGEYAMVKAAAQNGWIDDAPSVLELLTSISRAGADLILTYHAKDAADWLSS